MWKVLHSRWTVVLWVECIVLQWTLRGRYCTAGGQWNCGLNVVCYSEQYVEGTAQLVDCDIVRWMECVTVNIMWKLLHSRWTFVLCVECSVLHYTVCGMYCTSGGHWYCVLNVVCYCEQYVEGTSQQEDSGIEAWIDCVTVNIMFNLLHSLSAVLLWLEWTLLEWKLCGRYFTACGQCYCGLNGVCYSKQYVEGTAQQVESGIVAWMMCVTVNRMWKVLHSRWTVVLCVEWSVLQWTVCGSYWTAGGLLYCGLNGVCYNEHYVEGTAQQVDSSIISWMVCVTVNIMWMVLHSRWKVLFWVEWNIVHWTLRGRDCTAGRVWYCSLKDYVTVKVKRNLLHSDWSETLYNAI